MSILSQLSSQVGNRSTKSNLRVSAGCLAQPALLDEVVGGLASKDAALAGDCAEVFTEVAKVNPDLVVPYAEALSALLTHRQTRVRWEAMHALALVAANAPRVITSLLPRLRDIIHRDSSVIVRDYAVDALGNYAKTSKEAAEAAHPILVEALALWNGKQAARALHGLANVVSAVPSLSGQLRIVAAGYEDSGRGVVRKAAKELIKATERTNELRTGR
jgi:hypothetical protein